VYCSDTPVTISVDGVWACVGAGGQYSLHHLDTGAATPLFPHGPTSAPLVRRVMKVRIAASTFD